MTHVVHHALLVLALGFLGATGLRLAAATGAAGLVRVVAAAPFAVAIGVVHALALGVAGLGDAAWALIALAALTWWGVRTVVPAGGAGLREEWAQWWAGADRRARLAVGAGAGLWVVWVSWQLRFPFLDVDGLLYHLPLVASWMPDGDTGAATALIDGLPVGSYPLTNEVALAWAAGLSDALPWVSVWSPLLWALGVLAGWVGLRALRVPREVAALAVAAVFTLPLTVVQLGAPLTDLPALTWAVTTAALCAASVGRPALLAPAIVASAVAVGTKTTPAPLLLLALGAAAWASRGALRPLAVRMLGPAVVLGVLAGGVWMIRNTLSHGWPLWPFMEGPFGGDGLPDALRGFDDRFLDDPGAMLEGRTDLYAELLAGGLVLLGGAAVLALAAGAVRRSRAALAFGGATLVGVLAWGNAPYTGIQEPDALAVGAVRYLLPTLACAAAAIAVTAAGAPVGSWRRRIAAGVLGAAVLMSVARVVELGFPYSPSFSTLLLGVAGGVAVAAVAPRVHRWVARRLERFGSDAGVGGGGGAVVGRPTRAGTAALVAAAVLGALVLAGQANEYLIRHLGMQTFDAGILEAFLRDPEFSLEDGQVVAMAPATLGSLAGERLQHELVLIPGQESCTRSRARLEEGWVVAQVLPDTDRGRALVACFEGVPEMYRDARYVVWRAPVPASG